ncbi:MAG: serine/threonine-protein kinase [Gallionella sp.]
MDQPSNIGKYQVLKHLGQGATSMVYLGYDLSAKREVAIKVLNQKILNDPKIGVIHKKQLLTEASLAGKLTHPHIVNIYDAIVEEDESYVFMEYVAGGTLEQHTDASNLLPIPAVAEYMFKCCRALNYAQFNGVIHRDIKPANILLTEDKDIKISDMGAAIILNAEHSQVSDIGSPTYMSPEQINGEPLTHQTDIYSLGMVMFCLLTGRTPYAATSLASLFYQILNTSIPPVRSLNAEVSEQLEKIIIRATRKDKKDRYQTWKEFGNDLASCGRLEMCESKSQDVSTPEKFSALREIHFFRDFVDIALWEIVHIGEWEKYPANSILICEDELGQDFFILIEGTVGVTKGKRLLNLIKKGDSFGEMAYISGKAVPRSTTVTANSDVTVIRISPQVLAATSDHCQSSFNQAFLQTMADRLRAVDDRFANIVS